MRTYRSFAHMCLPARTLVRARNMRTVCRDRMTWADTDTWCARDAMPRHSPSSLFSSFAPFYLVFFIFFYVFFLLFFSWLRGVVSCRRPSVRYHLSRLINHYRKFRQKSTSLSLSLSPFRSRSKCLIGEYRVERAFPPHKGKYCFQLIFRFYLIYH